MRLGKLETVGSYERRKSAEENAPTLRDQFAMAVLTGVIAAMGLRYPSADAAEDAYKYADAMMKERAK